MTAADSLSPWLGERPTDAGFEGHELLARLRRDMFGAQARVRIGRYENLREVGRGGMGIVYRARDPKLRRNVAIKILRAEHPVARLRREARAMARLSHPNVVQVLAVAEDVGRVYVVMELVDGIDAAAWLREQPRTAAEILGVFVAAGRGLAAAHAAGIVHRDFKPGNVLVDTGAGAGRVRVTDFGLAGAARSEASTDAPADVPADDDHDDVRTHPGARLGTPRYMAPEQRRGDAVDARADQYALAVSLSEALYGEHPRLGPVSTATPPAAVPRHVRGVLRRALADDPSGRFASVDAMLQALSRPPRRRFVTLAALAGVLALFGVARASTTDAPCDATASVAAVWSTARARAVQVRLDAVDPTHGERFATDARPQIDTWTEDWIVREAAACRADPPVVTERRCLAGALHELDQTLALLEAADTAVARRLDRMVDGLARPRDCARAVEDAEPIDPDAADRLARDLAEARARLRAGQYRASAEVAARALAGADELDSDMWRTEAQYHLGHARMSASGGSEGHEELVRSFYGASSAGRAERAARAATSLLLLSSTRAEYAEAEDWSRHARTWVERVDDPVPLECELSVGEAELWALQDRWDDALAAVARAEATCDMRPSAPYDARLAFPRAQALLGTERYEEAVAAYEASVEGEIRLHGRLHSNVANALNNLGVARWYVGDHAGADEAYRQALEIRRAVFGDEHPKVAINLMNLGIMATDRGDDEEALRLLKDAEAMTRRTLGDHHPQLGQVLQNEGVTYGNRGDFVAARRVEEEAVRIFRDALGDEHHHTLEAQHNLASTVANAGDDVAAIETYEAAADAAQRAGRADTLAFAHILQNLAVSYRRLDQPAHALRLAEDALAIAEAVVGPQHPEIATTATILAGVALDAEQPQRAAWAAGIGRAIGPADARATGLASLHLARAWHELGEDPADIEPLLTEAHAQFVRAGPGGADSLERLREFAAVGGYVIPRDTE